MFRTKFIKENFGRKNWGKNFSKTFINKFEKKKLTTDYAKTLKP
jgi:hypothetical protein